MLPRPSLATTRRAAREPTSTTASDVHPLGPRISDDTYESFARLYAEAVREHGITLSAERLARPLQPASAAQRELLARAFAENPRFKLLHDAAHLGEELSHTVDSAQLMQGLQLQAGLCSTMVEFYNSDAWLAAADSRHGAEAPPRRERAGECTFCPGVSAKVLLTHDDGVCVGCLQPTTRAYMRRRTDQPVPLCCIECPGAPWEIDEIDDSDEEDEDERGNMVRYAELIERSYPACDCSLVRDSETVTVRRVPTCAGCEAVLSDASSRKRCAACEREYYCSKACQRAHWRTHKRCCKRC